MLYFLSRIFWDRCIVNSFDSRICYGIKRYMNDDLWFIMNDNIVYYIGN